MPKTSWYELQTEYRVIKQLLLKKELDQVTILISITINRPSIKVALLKVVLEAFTSNRVVVLCKCKGLCNTKRCQCFKKQKKCSVYYHHGSDDHDCRFLTSLSLRTEKALVSQTKAKANAGMGSASRSGSCKRA
jgi:hypothetical protein